MFTAPAGCRARDQHLVSSRHEVVLTASSACVASNDPSQPGMSAMLRLGPCHLRGPRGCCPWGSRCPRWGGRVSAVLAGMAEMSPGKAQSSHPSCRLPPRPHTQGPCLCSCCSWAGPCPSMSCRRCGSSPGGSGWVQVRHVGRCPRPGGLSHRHILTPDSGRLPKASLVSITLGALLVCVLAGLTWTAICWW